MFAMCAIFFFQNFHDSVEINKNDKKDAVLDEKGAILEIARSQRLWALGKK